MFGLGGGGLSPGLTLDRLRTLLVRVILDLTEYRGSLLYLEIEVCNHSQNNTEYNSKRCAFFLFKKNYLLIIMYYRVYHPEVIKKRGISSVAQGTYF